MIYQKSKYEGSTLFPKYFIDRGLPLDKIIVQCVCEWHNMEKVSGMTGANCWKGFSIFLGTNQLNAKIVLGFYNLLSYINVKHSWFLYFTHLPNVGFKSGCPSTPNWPYFKLKLPVFTLRRNQTLNLN